MGFLATLKKIHPFSKDKKRQRLSLPDLLYFTEVAINNSKQYTLFITVFLAQTLLITVARWWKSPAFPALTARTLSPPLVRAVMMEIMSPEHEANVDRKINSEALS